MQFADGLPSAQELKHAELQLRVLVERYELHVTKAKDRRAFIRGAAGQRGRARVAFPSFSPSRVPACAALEYEAVGLEEAAFGAGGQNHPFRSKNGVLMVCADKGKAVNLPSQLRESDGPLGLYRYVVDLHAIVNMLRSEHGECAPPPAAGTKSQPHACSSGKRCCRRGAAMVAGRRLT